MNEAEEAAYVRGEEAAYMDIVRRCLPSLEAGERDRASWMLERKRMVHALRDLCATHGDNDWPDTLDLEDVIRKHLAEHLQE